LTLSAALGYDLMPMSKTSQNLAIILAAGRGERAEVSIPKQFFFIGGKEILAHSIEKFETHPLIDQIVLVTHPDFLTQTTALVKKNRYLKVKKILAGGRNRQESSAIGVASAADLFAKVLIHDAVRPFVSQRVINECLQALDQFAAVVAAIPVKDTLLEVDSQNQLLSIPPRQNWFRVQTPQGFRLELIRKAHELARRDKAFEFTDDCGLVLHFRLAEILVVKGEERNIKITFPEDILLAEKLLEARRV